MYSPQQPSNVPDNGFFGALFDFSFKNFVTPRVIKVLYGLAVLFSAVVALGAIAAAFGSSTALGVVVLILSPLIFLLYVIWYRVTLEVVMAIFAIADNTKRATSLNTTAAAGPSPVPPGPAGPPPAGWAQPPSSPPTWGG